MKKSLSVISILILILFIVGCAQKAPVEDQEVIGEENESGGKLKLQIIPNNTTIDEINTTTIAETIKEEQEKIVEEEKEDMIEVVEIEEELEEENETMIYIIEEEIEEETSRMLFSPDLDVFYLDVGDGTAVFINTPSGKNIMIDCARKESARKIKNFLYDQKVELIDVLIISNPHHKQMGGCGQLASVFDIDKIYYNGVDTNTEAYDEFMEIAEEFELDISEVKTDMKLVIDEDLEVELILPYEYGWISNLEDNAILMKTKYGEVGFLFTGSCKKGCEQRLVEHEKNIDVDILMLGNNGGDDASSQLFLDKVTPATAVMILERDRLKDMPSFRTIETMHKRFVELYRTDYDGIVKISTDGKYYTVTPQWGVEHYDFESATNTSYTPYKDCPYISHVISNIFMPIECVYADDIAPHNRLCYKTIDEAKGWGLEKYRKCDNYWLEED